MKDKYERLSEKLKEELEIERKQTSDRVKELTLVSTKKVDLEFHIEKIKEQGNEY